MFDRLIFDSGKFNRETNNLYEGNIHGIGELSIIPEVIYYIYDITFSGSGLFSGILSTYAIIESNGEIIEGNPLQYGGTGGLELNLVMAKNILLSGGGELNTQNFGDAQTEILELRGIYLLPGQTMTIDTDSMIVLFGTVHDVSSLTRESIFFNLNEGSNQLNFQISYTEPPSSSGGEIEVTIIWQNRWL